MIPRDVMVGVPTFGSQHHYRINPDTSQTTLFNVSSLIADTRSESHGYDTEKYHERMRSGELLPHTPYERWKYDFHFNGSYYHRYNPGAGTSYHTASNWTNSDIQASLMYCSLDAFRTEAKLKDYFPQMQSAASKIYTQGHDTLTFVAELTKTIAMFKHARENLIKLLTKPGKWKSLAQSWLEFRYGWRTLWYDMVDISNALANLDDTRSRFSERAGASSTSVSSASVSFGTPGVSDVAATFTAVTTTKISVRGSVTADIQPPEFRANLAVTAWELITFSFIIDWFLNVGVWLEAMSVLSFSSAVTASGGVKINVAKTCSISSITFGTGQTGSGLCDSVATAEYSVRIPGSVPIIPLVNIRLDVPKFIDLWALALLKGAIPSLRH